MSPHEPAWIILECPECSSVSKFDPLSDRGPVCPTCGISLDPDTPPPMPDPNELLAAEEEEDVDEGEGATEVISYQPDASADESDASGSQLISDLNPQPEDELAFDAGRIRSTTDDDLLSPAEKRIRVKRKSKRVEKELTGWDKGDGVAAEDEGSQPPRRRRRKPSWVRPAKIAAISVVPAAFLCLTAYMVIAAMREKEAEPPPPSAADLARATLSALEAGSLDRERSKRIYTGARRAAMAFLDAANWRDRLAMVRDPERTGRLMEKFYAAPENADGPIAHRPIPEQGKVVIHKSLLLFTVESPEFDTRPLALEYISDDEFLVDWESFVGHCEIPWGEIAFNHQRREPFLVRVRAMERAYYNYGFQDDVWVSWQLEDRAGNHRIFGYVERDSPELLGLRMHAHGQKNKPVYMLLKVRFPENAPAGDQVEIVEVITNGWIAPAG